ncbi:MAG: hypothetical protein JSR73_07360 [Proteobacteria bacterium]|nr:hypothetical protein [Pseudomonadota bacterium]
MSREGLRIAALDRARRQAAELGDGAVVLMGVPLVVLREAPQRRAAPLPEEAANAEDAGAPRASALPGIGPLR